jgi:hypothetical protein
MVLVTDNYPQQSAIDNHSSYKQDYLLLPSAQSKVSSEDDTLTWKLFTTIM